MEHDQFLQERARYDKLRDGITMRHAPHAVTEVQRQWKEHDGVVRTLGLRFALLPQHASCLAKAAWELATSSLFIEGRLHPADLTAVRVWALKLWVRILNECRHAIPDPVEWVGLAESLWTPLLTPSAHPSSPPRPIRPTVQVSEKKQLEAAALNEFLPQYNSASSSTYRIKSLEAQERPDVILEDENGNLLGLEITHVYHDHQEAKILLGRSPTNFSGLQSLDGLLSQVNAQLQAKASTAATYPAEFPIVLVARVASPIFTWHDLNQALKDGHVSVPPSPFSEIWLLVRDDSRPHVHRALKLHPDIATPQHL